MFNLDDKRLKLDLPLLAHGRLNQPEAWLFDRPAGAVQSQFTWGEPVRVYGFHGDWALVQSERDGYCGCLELAALSLAHRPFPEPSHRSIRPAVILDRPDLKGRPLASIPTDSWLNLTAAENDYFELAQGGFIGGQAIESLDSVQEPVLTAAEQLNRSYIWGGRGLAGLDCSALVQYCYRRAGRQLPRDSDLQWQLLARDHEEVNAPRANDLIFITGHVMLATAVDEIIHASAHQGRVVREKFGMARERFRRDGSEQSLRIYRWKGNAT